MRLWAFIKLHTGIVRSHEIHIPHGHIDLFRACLSEMDLNVVAVLRSRVTSVDLLPVLIMRRLNVDRICKCISVQSGAERGSRIYEMFRSSSYNDAEPRQV